MLTTIWLAMQSCSSLDGDMEELGDYRDAKSNPVEGKWLSDNFIELPGGREPSVGLDSISNDTLKVFPNEAAYHTLLMRCIVSAQSMARIIAQSIDASVYGGNNTNWMNYFTPYLGVYSSVSDSRSKQWKLEEDVTYNGKWWKFHLSILDLPEGVVSDNGGENAVEMYYDVECKHGVMIFSPTDFDVVRFPVKIFGPDIVGVLTFDYDEGVVTNELYLTNIGVNNNVMYIRNVYLGLEQSDKFVTIKAMIDFPALWFDTKENSGFTVSSIGACDLNTGSAVLNSGIVRNSSREKTVEALVIDNPADEVFAKYYPLWKQMMEDSADTTATEEDDGAAAPGSGKITQSIAPDNDVSSEIPDLPVEYRKGYYQSGDCVQETNAYVIPSWYSQVDVKSEELKTQSFPLTPYKNSVNQIEWPSAEKTR